MQIQCISICSTLNLGQTLMDLKSTYRAETKHSTKWATIAVKQDTTDNQTNKAIKSNWRVQQGINSFISCCQSVLMYSNWITWFMSCDVKNYLKQTSLISALFSDKLYNIKFCKDVIQKSLVIDGNIGQLCLQWYLKWLPWQLYYCE